MGQADRDAEGLVSLIPVLNKLQIVFSRVGGEGINLPQIVVVGSQSSGKTSVLESLVQKDFLPRGSGIVTRRPLILQLVHIDEAREWAEFDHVKDKLWTDFEAVRKEIESETDRLCGGNKNVNPTPIILKVHSHKVLNLTLVDLPGLTKVATEGQPRDLPEQIRQMALQFIKPANAIILAISPANADLANSDALLIAKEVDPQGLRTIGVLTKLDMMDPATNARDVLTNRVYNLSLGFIGVVNRSQRDIDKKVPMADVLERERRFFRTHPAYRDIADVNGYSYLALTLNQILMKHIKARLPSVHQELNELLRRKQRELLGYGAAIGDTLEAQQLFLYKLLEHYLAEYEARLNGVSDDLRKNGLDGGQYLMDFLINEFPRRVEQATGQTAVDKEYVRNLVEANTGLQRPLFFPEPTFHAVVRQVIERLRQPSLDAVEFVAHRLAELHQKIHLAELDRFPRAKVLLDKSVTEIARESVESCVANVNALIDIQQSYVNADHPAFRDRAAALKGQSVSVDFLLELVDKYVATVKREVMDMVPKIVHRLLIKQSAGKLRLELFRRLVMHPDLGEAPDVAARRRKCQELIAALKLAASTLNEVRMARVE